MAGSVNKVILVGNLGRDPEIRFMPDGTKVASFSIATSEYWKDKTTGERRDRTEWHRISVLNDKIADIAEKYLRKGSKVYVEGQLQTRKWTDQSGAERTTTEILIGRFKGDMTLLDSNSRSGYQEEGAMADDSHTLSSPKNAPLQNTSLADLDDDMPF